MISTDLAGLLLQFCFFFSSRRRHTRLVSDWSSDVCSSDLPKYWQQRADYKIAATLDPARNELRGRETIHYTNHSPDALPYLWLFVEQNLCAPNSITNQLNQPPLVFLGSTFDFSCQGFNGGGDLG